MLYTVLWWRWIFPSPWLSPVAASFDLARVSQIPAALFNLIFPDDCRLCGQRLRELSRIPVCTACLAAPKLLVADCYCANCHASFLNNRPLDDDQLCGLCRRGLTGFDAAYSFGGYDGPLRELIHLFKYGRVKPLARPLSKLLACCLPREQRFDLIVPLPLHWWRRWQRGFNQSSLLAEALSQRLRLPWVDAVQRTRQTAAQTGLTRRQRRDNVSGAFAVKQKPRVEGRHVLLIDDVLTTGATASACALALKRGGAKRVTALTLARADRRRENFLKLTEAGETVPPAGEFAG